MTTPETITINVGDYVAFQSTKITEMYTDYYYGLYGTSKHIYSIQGNLPPEYPIGQSIMSNYFVHATVYTSQVYLYESLKRNNDYVYAQLNTPGTYTFVLGEYHYRYATSQNTLTLIVSDKPKIPVNVSGSWKESEGSVNVNGSWKAIDKIHVNVNGVWKEI